MFNFSQLINEYLLREDCQEDNLSVKYKSLTSQGISMYHFTASGIVVRDDSILLIHHRYLNQWLQPGGHIDHGEEPYMAAQREVLEETGWITSLIGDEIPVNIDIHLIPKNPIKLQNEHWHIDCAYLLSPKEQVAASDAELHKWFNFKEVSNLRLRNLLNKLGLI